MFGKMLFRAIFWRRPADPSTEDNWVEEDESYRRRIRAHINAIGMRAAIADTARLDKMGERLGLPRGRRTPLTAAPRRRPF